MLARLAASPDIYPQRIDLSSLMVLLVQFDADAYRRASFLDDRIVTPATVGAWAGLDKVAEESRRVRDARPVHFIFHTGHVGSTLVSRLLDETGFVLSLREPLPLRTLAEAHDAAGRIDALLSGDEFDRNVAMLMRLWSRGYQATRSVVIKATSSAGRLAATLLSASEVSRAIYLNLRAEPYLATLLAGQNSPTDLRGHGPERMRRLASRTGSALTPLHSLSLGELAAMSWLAESWSQRDALKQFPTRIIGLDFDRFLESVGPSIGGILGHFGLPAEGRQLEALGRSSVLTRYSKAPEFAYTPNVRAELLRDSRRRNSDQIRRGMAWLERMAASDDAVADIVTGSGS
ncbi:MAG TPA: hypothetical protein VH704_08860 [Casimicrobiaceae bacterium]|nr:hypothetical protein [Casimicrobiaceae bacterium]